MASGDTRMERIELFISWTIVIASLCYSLYLLPGFLGGIFTIGANDSPFEILAMFTYCLSIPAASIRAIFRRRQSGYWLIAASVVSAVGFTEGELYVAHRHNTAVHYEDIHWGLVVSLIPLAIGVFFLVMDLLGWPALNASARGATNEPTP